jgi:ABC-type phosphate/phosphonate transport system substrate-binding protein
MFRPLNREEQKRAFEEKLAQFSVFQESPPIPTFPVQPVKDMKPPETDQLALYQQRLAEYGKTAEIAKEAENVQQHIEDTKQKKTIQTFYCSHSFMTVAASWMGIPIKYKICKKCNLVK